MSENTVDIKTINNQLNYLKATKAQLQQALVEKGLPIDDTTPFRDYVSQLSNMENVMRFNSMEDMEAKTDVADGALAIVYKNGGKTVTATDTFKGPIYIPKRFDAGMTIDELSTKMGWWTATAVSNYRYGYTNSFSIVDDEGTVVVSGSVYCRSWNLTSKSHKYEYTWTFSTSNGTVRYVADTTENLAETTLFKMSPDIDNAYWCAGGSADKEYHFVLHTNEHTSSIKKDTSPMVAMFFRSGEMTFDGLYRYSAENACWESAPTDLVPIDGDVYAGKYMGFNGVSEGTMSVPKYYNNDTIEDMGIQYSKFMNLVTSLDTTNITDFSNFYSKLPANSRYLPFITVTENAVNCSKMMHNAYSITNMSLNHWNVSNVTNMSYMFANSSFSGGNLNLINWNMSNVTNGCRMFYNAGLSQLYMSGGENIKDMSYMFATNRTSFGNYGLNRFQTNSATNMVGTFYRYGGNRANVCNWNVSNVTNMSHMFFECKNLNMFTYTGAGGSYDMRISWTAPNCLNTYNMFTNCPNITYINLGGSYTFTPKSQNTANMFLNCVNFYGFTGNQYAAIGIANTLNAHQMFANCYNIQTRVATGSLANCTNTAYMFANCKLMYNNCFNRITFNFSNCTNMAYMFYGCANLQTLPAINWNMPLMTNLYGAFASTGIINMTISGANIPLINNLFSLVGSARAENLVIKDSVFSNMTNLTLALYYVKSITIDNIKPLSYSLNNIISWESCDFLTTYKFLNMNMDGITSLSGMFNNCQNLTTIALPSNFTFANVTDMSNMFTNCRNLPNLDVLKGKDLSNVTTMANCFRACSNLQFADDYALNIPNVTNISSMFYSCGGLTTVNIYTNNSTNITSCYALFRSCGNLVNYTYDFSTDNCKSYSDMFAYCKKLNHIDTTKLNFTCTTSTINMFLNCTNLTEIDLSNANMSNITTAQNMFMNCNNLVNVPMGTWDLTNLTNGASMFNNCYNISNWNIGSWKFGSNLLNASMFACSSFDDVNGFSNRSFDSLVEFKDIFLRCHNIKVAHLSDLNMPLVANFTGVFSGCTNLTDLTISNLYIPSINNLYGIASGCDNLVNLTLENINTNGKGAYAYWGFASIYNLVNLTMNCNNFRCSNMASLFSYCNNLSNASIYNIINWILASNSTTVYKNLSTSNFYSPFYRTPYTKAYYADKVTELEEAGWTF